ACLGHRCTNGIVNGQTQLSGTKPNSLALKSRSTEAVPRQAVAPQKWWAEANRLVGAARAAFENRQPAPVVVRFEMHPAWRPPNRRDSLALAIDLARIVEEGIAEPPPFTRPGQPITLRDPHPDVIWSYIGTTRKELGGHWEPSFAHEVRQAS